MATKSQLDVTGDEVYLYLRAVCVRGACVCVVCVRVCGCACMYVHVDELMEMALSFQMRMNFYRPDVFHIYKIQSYSIL